MIIIWYFQTELKKQAYLASKWQNQAVFKLDSSLVNPSLNQARCKLEPDLVQTLCRLICNGIVSNGVEKVARSSWSSKMYNCILPSSTFVQTQFKHRSSIVQALIKLQSSLFQAWLDLKYHSNRVREAIATHYQNQPILLHFCLGLILA